MGGGGQQAEADAAAARRAAISKNRQNELREEQGIEQGMMKAQAERRKDVIARFGNVGGGGPGGGGPGGRGGAGADSAPGNFHTPSNAVTSFLNALQARDADRLAEATALRAALESSSKTQPWFEKILGLSLSDSELDDLAKKLEGFTVSGENPPKSTGRVEVVLQKALAGNVGYVRRTVVVRHEKKGWGVLDIGGPSEFKMPTMRPLNKTTGRRNY